MYQACNTLSKAEAFSLVINFALPSTGEAHNP